MRVITRVKRFIVYFHNLELAAASINSRYIILFSLPAARGRPTIFILFLLPAARGAW